MSTEEITSKELHALMLDGCWLIDVREPVEHAEEHVEGAQLIPLGELKSRVDEIGRDRPLVVMCRSGKRGGQAMDTLRPLGFSKVKNLSGGIQAWKDAGLPVGQSPKKVFPLMQQVQIVIGAGILTGVVLSKVAHPNFIYLSAFFGAGLLLAGLSGWCGLALLMSKMPWNRLSDGKSFGTASCAISN